ncbi:MAG: glycosyltransferase family 2 protein, partial [Patescibacteria group bacterium]
MKNISIVIPVHNEEEIIEGEVKGILTSLAKELPALDYEILLVENGSKDRTKQIAEKLSSEVPRIKIISLPLPSYGGALKTGILRSQGDVVVIFNIDFWDIVFIKKALNIHEKWDLVVGSKNALGAEDLRLVTRRLLTKFFNVFLRVFFGFRGTDTHGMKVMRRDKVSSIAERCRPNKMLFDTELVLRAQHKGLIIKEIPVVCEEKRPSTLIPSSPIKIIKTGIKVIKDLTIIFISLYLGKARQRMARS